MRILIGSQNIPGTFNQCRGVAERILRDDAAAGVSVGPLTIHRLSKVEALLSRVVGLSRLLPPVLLLSCGSVGETRARQLVRGGRRCLWAHIEAPRGTDPRPDLVFISRHDWLPEFDDRPGYVALDGVPHAMDPQDLANRREGARRHLGLSDRDRMTAVLLGGENSAFAYTASIRDRILADLHALAVAGRRVFVTGSRRTDPALMQRLVSAQKPGLTVYDGRGDNPYRDYLAAADEILVSEDSISMCCEALVTGRPVSLIRLEAQPGPRLDKFRRFQTHMIDTLGVLHGDLEVSPAPSIERRPVPHDAERVAGTVLKALRAHIRN